MLSKKIIGFLYNIIQRRRIKKYLYPYSIENPLDYLHAYNRHNGFEVSQDILSFGDKTTTDSKSTLERIIRAYKLSKKNQPKTGAYSVSGMWYDNLQLHYKHLIDLSSNANSIESLNSFLSNFFRQNTYGLSASGTYPKPDDSASCESYINSYLNNLCSLALHLGIPYIRKNMDSEFLIFDDKVAPSKIYMDICNKLCISPDYTITGNPFGFKMQTPNGIEIIPSVAFRHLYIALQILKLKESTGRTRILEIGGGFGGVPYFINKFRNQSFNYWSMDIPEINIISSYFLIKSLPDVEIVLYGENAINSNNSNVIHILPNWELTDFKPDSIDIALNADSMPEIPEKTVIEYLSRIASISKYFYSYNQDCGTQGQTRLSQIDTDGLGLKCLSTHIAWLRHGYFERTYKTIK